MSEPEKRFNIHTGFERTNHGLPKSIPWSKIEPLRARCNRQHGQSLEKLNERGGLSIFEIYCHVNDLSFFNSKSDPALVRDWFYSWLGSEALPEVSVVPAPPLNKRTLVPISDAGDAADFNDALAEVLAIFANKHGPANTANMFAGPFSCRIMAACQKFVNGEKLSTAIDSLSYKTGAEK